MELAEITMDPEEARAKFVEYRDAVRARHDEELVQIMRGYRAIAKGNPVIDLAATIRGGGGLAVPVNWRENPMWLPAIAVMRADEAWCWVHTASDGAVQFHSQRWPSSNQTRNLIRLPAGTLTHPKNTDWCHWEARAMVPPVPPSLQPKYKLGNYHILFEAQWEAVAPKDPALLHHLGGDLYAVLATWNLTELERAVLAGRYRS